MKTVTVRSRHNDDSDSGWDQPASQTTSTVTRLLVMMLAWMTRIIMMTRMLMMTLSDSDYDDR